MYRKNANGWLKHIDFIILDMICLQIAFGLAYFIKNGNIHLYNDFLYRNMAIILEVADLMSIPLSEVHAIRYRSPHNPLKKSIFF